MNYDTAPKPEVVTTGSSYIFYCRRLLKNYSEKVLHSLLNDFVRHNRHRHGTFYNADAQETKQLQTKCSKIYYGSSETGSYLHKLHKNVYNVFCVVTHVL